MVLIGYGRKYPQILNVTVDLPQIRKVQKNLQLSNLYKHFISKVHLTSKS